MPHLRCEIEQDLATIVLNNPPQNRLAPQMVDELCEIVKCRWQERSARGATAR